MSCHSLPVPQLPIFAFQLMAQIGTLEPTYFSLLSCTSSTSYLSLKPGNSIQHGTGVPILTTGSPFPHKLP